MRLFGLGVWFAVCYVALSALCRADDLPTPKLTTFYDHAEGVFGMWWISAGSEYNYVLEANESDGFGWFTVATWLGPAKNSAMSGYTYIQWDNSAIARVRVYRATPAPTPKDLARWKILTPVQF